MIFGFKGLFARPPNIKPFLKKANVIFPVFFCDFPRIKYVENHILIYGKGFSYLCVYKNPKPKKSIIMAKKSPSMAMEFEFLGTDLERLLSSKPKKVLFTVWVEVVKTDKGKEVGALQIKASREANTKSKSKALRDGGDAYGHPKPPGIPE
jgi:hypothetical protein